MGQLPQDLELAARVRACVRASERALRRHSCSSLHPHHLYIVYDCYLIDRLKPVNDVTNLKQLSLLSPSQHCFYWHQTATRNKSMPAADKETCVARGGDAN